MNADRKNKSDRLEFYQSRAFGELKDGYSEIHEVQRAWMNSLGMENPVRLLDIGCGTGAGTSVVSVGLPRGSSIFGIDLSCSSLTASQKRSIHPIVADFGASHLPIRDGSLDIVVLDEVIEHVVETDDLLDEIRRVLVPGGILLLSTPNLAAWFNRFALLLGIQPAYSEVSFRKIYGRPGNEVVGHLRLFTLNSLVGILEDAGFQIEQIQGFTFSALPKVLHGIDRLFRRRPSLSAGIVLYASKKSSV